jgi:hypothetical protein
VCPQTNIKSALARIIAATRSRLGSWRGRAPFPPTDVIASRALLAPPPT